MRVSSPTAFSPPLLAILRLVTGSVLALVALLGAMAAQAPTARAIGYAPLPLSIATGPAGDVYLSDPANGQVQKFSSDGRLLDRWGHFGRTYSDPRDIATDATGNVYVADSFHGRLRVFTANGTPVRQWRSASRAVAVDPTGYVYVVGYLRMSRYRGSFQVEKFAPDGSLLTTWGAGNGGAQPQLGEPWGIAAGPSGEVYVPDWNGQVRAFSGGGDLLTSWATSGFPFGVATDPAGNVYVTDGVSNEVEKFSPGGARIAVLGSNGSRPGHFIDPMSVAVDSGGDVYVATHTADYLDGGGATRVEKFSPDGRFLTQWHSAPALPTRPRLSASVGRRTAKRGATFRFRSQPSDAHFRCRLIGERVPRKLRRPRPCTSPKRYRRLRPGRKVFLVVAVSGGERSGEAARAWRIVK
jgi:NHL repeat